MNRHYPGYSEARADVAQYDLPELLDLIDALFGRDKLRYADDVEAVRAEAYRQLEIEWRDTSEEAQRENSLVAFHLEVIAARRERRL